MVCGNVLSADPPRSLTDAAEKPAPILRSFTPGITSFAEEEAQDAWETPRWERVLLWIFGGAAILAVIAFVIFCLAQYGGAWF